MKDYAIATLMPGLMPERRGNSAVHSAAHSAMLGDRVFFIVRHHHDRERRFTEARSFHQDEQTRACARRGEERIEYKSGGWIRFITERQADSARGHTYDMVLVDSDF